MAFFPTDNELRVLFAVKELEEPRAAGIQRTFGAERGNHIYLTINAVTQKGWLVRTEHSGQHPTYRLSETGWRIIAAALTFGWRDNA